MCSLNFGAKLTDGVMSPSIVVGGVLLSGDELLRMEKLAISSKTHLVNHSRFQINEYGPEKKVCNLSRPTVVEKYKSSNT